MQLSQIAVILAGIGVAFYVLTTNQKEAEDAVAAGYEVPDGKSAGGLFGKVLSKTGINSISGDKTPSGPEGLRKTGMRGYELASPGMAAAGDQVFLIPNAVEDFTAKRAADTLTPIAMDIVPAATQCKPRAVKSGEKIANVHIGRTNGLVTQVEVISEGQLAYATNKWIEKQLSKRKIADTWGKDIAMGPLKVTDVVVTDTSAPLYLVLHSSSAGSMWTVHTAPGVDLAHVTVVSPGRAGLVLPDPAISHEVLDTRAAGCLVQPQREPRAHWGFIARVLSERHMTMDLFLAQKPADQSFAEYLETGRIWSSDEIIIKNFAQHEAYSNWFKGLFGVPANHQVLGHSQANHVLVGPKPSGDVVKATYTSIDGSTPFITDGHMILNEPINDRRMTVAKAQGDLAQRALGKELSAIIPTTMELTQ